MALALVLRRAQASSCGVTGARLLCGEAPLGFSVPAGRFFLGNVDTIWQRAFPWVLISAGIGVFAASVYLRKRAMAAPPPSPQAAGRPPAEPPPADAPDGSAQYVHEQLLLAAAANDAGACAAANDALLEALHAMGNFSGGTRRRMDDRLRSVLLRRYSDPTGLCL